MTPLGEHALRFPLDPGPSPLAELRNIPGVIDVVLAEEVGAVSFAGEPDARAVVDALARGRTSIPAAPRFHVVEVVYDGEDLDAVAATLDVSRASVIAMHSEPDYRVAMLGFLPGFAYLRGLPGALRLPRRAPRPRVPGGSVAVAAHYTGIYPSASPGGWHLLGRAPAFVPFASGRATFDAGDVVRFVPTERGRDAEDAPWELPAPDGRPHLELVRCQGVAVLVDDGRRGRMHEGIPPGGPLVRAAFEAANIAVGNPAGACALELTGAFEFLARGGPVTIAAPDTRTLQDGERHAVATGPTMRVRYLALAGGIDAPVWLGGRGVLLSARIGRPLKKGDRLSSISRHRLEATGLRPLAPGHGVAGSGLGPGGASGPRGWADEEIALVPGPDEVASAFEVLLRGTWRIAIASDRSGTRLESELDLTMLSDALARPSAPMVLGAIELTPSGPIVLGPDHPTTGGYPVIGVVRAASRDAFFSRPPGSLVRFRR